MDVLEPTVTGSQTLAGRLSQGRMPEPEALCYATLLGEALRGLHDSGKVHGAVSPESVILRGAEVSLTPAGENWETRAADMSTDILAFGAVLYEMLTGRNAFSREAGSSLEPTGIPMADRLIAACLADERSPRPATMQKVLLELKLVTLAARRAQFTAAKRRDASPVALRSEVQAVEARLSARLEEQAKNAAEGQQAAGEVLNALRRQSVTLEEGVAAARQRVEASATRLIDLEQSLDSMSQRNATLEVRLGKLEDGIQPHAASIESLRAALAQTDDLVERVVEAMETIQASILDS